MSVLSDNYKRILSELEANVSNPEELEFIKAKMSELSMIFMDVIDNLSNMADQKMKQLEEKQGQIEEKMSKVQNAVNEIETEMYSEDEDGFEFEIVCPYCSYEFVTDLNTANGMRTEVQCPECSNLIELDWNEEEEESSCCGGGHCGCPHSEMESVHEDEEEYDEEDIEEIIEIEDEDQEDDM